MLESAIMSTKRPIESASRPAFSEQLAGGPAPLYAQIAQMFREQITSGQLASSVVAVGGSLPRARSQPSAKLVSPTRLASTVPSRRPIGMKRIFAITLPAYRQLVR